MRLLYIVNIFPRLSETFVLDEITYLLNQGYMVSILSFLKPENIDPPDNLIHGDVHHYQLLERVYYFSDVVGTIEDLYCFRLTPDLANILSHVDLIIAHFANTPAQIAERLSFYSGIPYIFVAHARDIFVNVDIAALHQRVDRAAKVIVPTEFNKQYLLNLLGGGYDAKIQVIHHGIDLARFAPKPRRRQQEEPLVVLSIGRLVGKKGIDDAIRAFALTLPSHQNATLRIVGDGPLKSEIAHLVNELGLQSQVHLLGYSTHLGVREELQRADVFVLPSRTAQDGDREGLPVAILEASAMCLPVVSTFHTGIPEGVVHGKTGFLVPERDIACLAEKLELLLRDEKLRAEMGTAGREHVAKHYDLNSRMNELATLIHEVVAH
jgi:colanic acid/amylovoran biosynthesis glycosyltransferase